MGSKNQNLKEIRALGSEKIAARTDGRTVDGQKSQTMTSADRVKQSKNLLVLWYSTLNKFAMQIYLKVPHYI